MMNRSDNSSKIDTTGPLAPQQSLRPDPPSLQEIKSQQSQGGNEGDDEDEIVAQARAIALNAAKLSKNKKGLNLLIEKEELPLGDLQQRKLIEAKLGQKLKEPATPVNPLKALDKIGDFFHEQQQKIEESLSQFDISKNKSQPTSPIKLSIDPDHANAGRSSAAVVDSSASSTPSVIENDTPVVLSSVVWKRRSGYGKYSTSRAWERRRMDLKGSTIRYFKTINTDNESSQKPLDTKWDSAATSDDELIGNSESFSRPSSPLEPALKPLSVSRSTSTGSTMKPPPVSRSASTGSNIATNPQSTDIPSNKQKKDIRGLWEQAKENITKTTENITTSLTSHQALDPNAPRGSIDLIKENAIVGAISSAELQSNAMSINMGAMSSVFSSVSPTPFGISIIVKNESKWKICFDTQKEQMHWLAVLTEVVVKNNVDMYNDELTKSRRGVSTRARGSIQASAGMKAGDEDVSSEEVFRAPPGGKADDLWKVDEQFSMKSILSRTDLSASGDSAIDIARDGSFGNKDVKDESDDASEKVSEKSLKAPDTLLEKLHHAINHGATSGPAFSLRGNNVCVVVGVLNFILYASYLTESKWAFRFFVVSANVIFWMLVVNDSPDRGTSSDMHSDKERLRSSLLTFIEDYIRDVYQESDKEVGEPISTKVEEKSEPLSVLPLVKEGFKPIAGSSSKRVEDESESDELNGSRFIRWRVLPPEEVQVRSHGYLQTKKENSLSIFTV